MTAEVGLRELRQHASDVVRRAEAGERIAITVNGRARAELVPLSERAWRTWDEVAAALAIGADAGLADDLLEIDDEILDPFTRFEDGEHDGPDRA